MSDHASTLAGAPPDRRAAVPELAPLGVGDVATAVGRGLRDLRLAPFPGLAIGAFFVLGGLGIYLLVTLAGLSFLAYPLAAGFALVGPFAAVALYEISRRLELGAPVTWRDVARVVCGSGARSLGWMPMLNLFVFLIWIDVAAALFIGFFGLRMPALPGFLIDLLTTPQGLAFLLAGNLAGAVFAGGIFGSTVVAYPMLLDRDTDFVTAIATSWRVVRANPLAMGAFALCVAVLLFVAMLPFFAGLVVVLPLLGHATWHLYRLAIRWPVTDGAGAAR